MTYRELLLGYLKEDLGDGDITSEAILDGEIPNNFEAAYRRMLEEGKAMGLTVRQELKRGKD